MVPAVGAHLTENRKPTVILDATDLFSDHNLFSTRMDMLFPILGHLCGTLSDGKVAILIGLEKWSDQATLDNLKSFCAAFGTTGSSPLIHIAGITPEARDKPTIDDFIVGCNDNRRIISVSQLEETLQTLDSGGTESDEEVKLIALGNPHLSTSECELLADLVQSVGLPKRPDIRLIACISRDIYEAASKRHLETLKDFGMEFVNDTCWCMLLDAPVIPADPKAKILTNSGKYSHYGPALTNRLFRFGSLEDCIQTATSGTYRISRLSGTTSPTRLTSRRRFATTTLQTTRKLLRLWR
jgi:predicted aconitase